MYGGMVEQGIDEDTLMVHAIVEPFVDVAVWFAEALAGIAQHGIADWIGRI